jgi:hypothetical protein
MNSQICKCCGQHVTEAGAALTRNPNICVACAEAEEGGIKQTPAEPPAALLVEDAGEGEPGPTAFAM